MRLVCWMKKMNKFNLTMRSLDFNLLPRYPKLLQKLRKLILHRGSGMDRELDHLTKIMATRPVNAKVILVYRYPGKLVGWELLSKERSAISFWATSTYFEPHDGMLLEIFVDPKFRRQGIGTEIMKVARRKAGPYRLCVAPWDVRSRAFFRKFSNYQNKWL